MHGASGPTRRGALALCVLAGLVAVTGAQPVRPTAPVLLTAGLAVGPDGAVPIAPDDMTTRFLPGTSVPVGPLWILPASGRGTSVSAGLRTGAAAAARAWLATGTVPGTGTRFAGMSERALLDLRALTGRHGAVVAGWAGPWHYVWPRDASFVAVAYAATGHREDAAHVLDFLAAVAPADGRWQARYLPDASGRVPDDRGLQLDASGWVPWATWFWWRTAADRTAAAAHLATYWPMVSASADAAAAVLGPDGLPEASSDYWERDERDLTLGTAAPLLLGLRSAAELAEATGRPADAARWRSAAARLAAALQEAFGAQGYPRTLGSGMDAAVTFLAPPYAAPSDDVADAVAHARAVLAVGSGGLSPGEDWKHDGVAWTPETAMFALAAAAAGDRDDALQLLDWLDAHRTGVGSLPEKVTATGAPASVAPLGWTDALVLLALRALERPLPVPPA